MTRLSMWHDSFGICNICDVSHVTVWHEAPWLINLWRILTFTCLFKSETWNLQDAFICDVFSHSHVHLWIMEAQSCVPYAHSHTFIQTCIHTYVHTFILHSHDKNPLETGRWCWRWYTYIYMYMYMYMYIYMYICIYIYIHIYRNPFETGRWCRRWGWRKINCSAYGCCWWPWLIHVCHDSFTSDVTHLYVTWLIYMRRDLCMHDGTRWGWQRLHCIVYGCYS